MPSGPTPNEQTQIKVTENSGVKATVTKKKTANQKDKLEK
jgi:hypothetical protein